MPAPPTVIVQRFSNFQLDPSDATRVVFTIDYDISFVPDEGSLPQARQDEISIAVSGLTKAGVKSAVETRIVAEVAALGGNLAISRIFNVADLV